MKKVAYALFVTIILVGLVGCGSSNNPFEAQFMSRDEAIVTFQGKQYHLSRFQEAPADLPFEYAFEPDGDLDLTLDGKEYELDNPFDIDSKKKKKTTTVKKKTVSKKKSKR